jgi:NAD(P)H-dependent FMN reductase
MNLLLVPGSLRAGSSNHRALALDTLPYFNPDVEEAGPPPVAVVWRAEIGWADAVIISSPEYAHGIPGVLKNALDWLVGGVEVVGKPIALINATPPATFAGAQLREVLRTMGGVIVEHASVDVSLRGDTRAAASIAEDPAIASRLRAALDALTSHISLDRSAVPPASSL